MNKKGVLGLSAVKGVIVAILIIALLVVVGILVSTQLRDTYEATETKLSKQVKNETTDAAVTDAGYTYYKSNHTVLRNPTCTVIEVTNYTSGLLTIAANYTVDNCKIKYSHATVNPGGFTNNTRWNITYSVTYNDPGAYAIVGNLSEGATGFFKNTSTFMTLLGVVVLILIITIVIVAVQKFSGGGIAGGGSVSEEL